tara:strand:+ start:2250 stop:3026 length:777 start_codon:yes stop_codon:yes gene_type:complete
MINKFKKDIFVTIIVLVPIIIYYINYSISRNVSSVKFPPQHDICPDYWKPIDLNIREIGGTNIFDDSSIIYNQTLCTPINTSNQICSTTDLSDNKCFNAGNYNNTSDNKTKKVVRNTIASSVDSTLFDVVPYAVDFNNYSLCDKKSWSYNLNITWNGLESLNSSNCKQEIEKLNTSKNIFDSLREYKSWNSDTNKKLPDVPSISRFLSDFLILVLICLVIYLGFTLEIDGIIDKNKSYVISSFFILCFIYILLFFSTL